MVASLRPVKDNNHVVPKPKEGSDPPIFRSYEFRSLFAMRSRLRRVDAVPRSRTPGERPHLPS